VYARTLQLPAYSLPPWREQELRPFKLDPIPFEQQPLPKHWRGDEGTDKVQIVLTFAPDVTLQPTAASSDPKALTPAAVVLLTTPMRADANDPPSGFERLLQALAAWVAFAVYYETEKPEPEAEQLWKNLRLTAEQYRQLGARLAGEDEYQTTSKKKGAIHPGYADDQGFLFQKLRREAAQHAD
jgi:hypothetical protein